MQEIRTGKISTINAAKGVARVVYEDKDMAVSSELPILCSGVYTMPKIGDTVLVAHLPNGSSSGVILGKIFNSGNSPQDNTKAEDLIKTIKELKTQVKDLQDRVTKLESEV